MNREPILDHSSFGPYLQSQIQSSITTKKGLASSMPKCQDQPHRNEMSQTSRTRGFSTPSASVNTNSTPCWCGKYAASCSQESSSGPFRRKPHLLDPPCGFQRGTCFSSASKENSCSPCFHVRLQKRSSIGKLLITGFGRQHSIANLQVAIPKLHTSPCGWFFDRRNQKTVRSSIIASACFKANSISRSRICRASD